MSLHALSFGCRDTGEWQNWSTDPDAFGSSGKAQAQVPVQAELSSQCQQCLQTVPGAGLVFQPFLSPAVAQLLLPALLPAWYLGLSPLPAWCRFFPSCSSLGRGSLVIRTFLMSMGWFLAFFPGSDLGSCCPFCNRILEI